jgi:hypothetical protein
VREGLAHGIWGPICQIPQNNTRDIALHSGRWLQKYHNE